MDADFIVMKLPFKIISKRLWFLIAFQMALSDNVADKVWVMEGRHRSSFNSTPNHQLCSSFVLYGEHIFLDSC